MTQQIVVPARLEEGLMLRVAREIAIDLHEIDTILQRHHIDHHVWRAMQAHPRFIQLLTSEKVAWESALNTAERVKVKASALIEEWLQQANTELHSNAPLNHKAEIAKILTRIAGLDQGKGENQIGDRFVFTINLGADNRLQIDKSLPPKVIEGELESTP